MEDDSVRHRPLKSESDLWVASWVRTGIAAQTVDIKEKLSGVGGHSLRQLFSEFILCVAAAGLKNE